MPVLIKVKETGKIQHFYVEKIFQNFAILREKAKYVLTVSHFQPKRVFFFLLFKPLLQCILTRGTSYSLIKVSSFQMRYLLSNLNGGFRSYLRTTKRCQTRYFMLAPTYQCSDRSCSLSDFNVKLKVICEANTENKTKHTRIRAFLNMPENGFIICLSCNQCLFKMPCRWDT